MIASACRGPKDSIFFIVLEQRTPHIPFGQRTTTKDTTMKSNDSLGLSREERDLVVAGQRAMDEMKKDFTHWVDGIGPALKMLKTKPGADNRKRWKTIREEAGFGAIEPAVVSRLLAVMADDKIDAVKKWHASLPTNQQFKWCSPAAIMKHCPIFSRPAAAPAAPKQSRYNKLEGEHAIALEELHRLKRELRDSTPHREVGTGALMWEDNGGDGSERAKVNAGVYQLDQMGPRTYAVSYISDDDQEGDGEDVAEITISDEEIARLCLERARAVAEQDWARRQASASPAEPVDDAVVTSDRTAAESVTLELTAEPVQDDGLDIPNILRRAPSAAEVATTAASPVTPELESAPEPATESASESLPASSKDAVWALKKFSQRSRKYRMGHTLTMGVEQYVIAPVPPDSRKRLKGYNITLKIPGMEDRDLGFVGRDTSKLRGAKADDDARERAVALVREHAGLQVGFTRKDAEITELEDFRAAKTRQESKERRAVKKIAAAMKSAEPIKTALPEFTAQASFTPILRPLRYSMVRCSF